MQEVVRPTCLLIALVAGCYMEPDTHRASDEARASEAGTAPGLDASDRSSSAPEAGRAPEFDGELPSAPDATSDTGPSPEASIDASDAAMAAVDAGCLSPEWCTAARPTCRAGECVACESHADCARYPSTPACGPSGSCVACTTDSKALCAGATPACDAQTNGCVACTADSKALCVGASPACDPQTKSCVECVVDNDCASAEKAACGADRLCGACKEDADCSRFSKVCDTTSGACVQCRPQSEETDCRSDASCDPKTADCAGTACDPKLLVCTSRQRASVAICGGCVSDSECRKDHRCIAMTHGTGSARRELGGFCLKTAESGCTEPFRAPAISRASLSGAAATNYCGISETVTSCPAIEANRAARKCTDAASCGPGGRCEPVNFGDEVCTYSCASPLFCPAAYPCAGPAGGEYCGGPSG